MPCPALLRVLAGHVLEVGVDHRRAHPLDQPALDHPSSTSHWCLVLAAAPFAFPSRWQTCSVRSPALAAAALSRKCRSDQVQAAQLADRKPPSASQVTTHAGRVPS